MDNSRDGQSTANNSFLCLRDACRYNVSDSGSSTVQYTDAHSARYDRSNVRCNKSKKKKETGQRKNKKIPQQAIGPAAPHLKCIPSFSTELDENSLTLQK